MIEYTMRKATVSFLLAAFASVLSLILPLYREQTVVLHSGKPSTLQVRRETLPSVNGPMIYYTLAIPVIVAGLPLLLRFRALRIICAALLATWVVLGAASIGIFYVPSAIAMALAASEKTA